jgi:hypothetical protein
MSVVIYPLSDMFNQVEEMSEALLNRGAPLEATTAVNIRAGPYPGFNRATYVLHEKLSEPGNFTL